MTAVGVASALGLLAWCGCGSPSTPGAGTKKGTSVRRFDEDLFKVSVHGLNQVEDYDVGQALRQTTDRLNQWIAHQPVESGWKPDPLLATLPEALAKLEPLKDLDKLELRTSPLYRDDFYLWEAVWLRDLAQTARGEKPDALHQAASLFDWIVRNIQLEPIPARDEKQATGFAQRPWETLLLGRGSALDRAWVFVLLARSQGIDAGLISVSDASATAQPAPGLVGVLHEGEIYLFDLALGLPVPAPDSMQIDSTGQLTMRPATLSQAVADSNVLRQLDATLELPYPLKAEQLQKAVVLLEASPSALSQRMKLIESRSAGEDRLPLCAAPSAQAQRFRACKHVADVRLWPHPFTILADEVQAGPMRAKWQFIMLLPFQTAVGNTLWRGRVYQIKGKLNGSHGVSGAVQFYQSVHQAQRQLLAGADRRAAGPAGNGVGLPRQADPGDPAGSEQSLDHGPALQPRTIVRSRRRAGQGDRDVPRRRPRPRPPRQPLASPMARIAHASTRRTRRRSPLRRAVRTISRRSPPSRARIDGAVERCHETTVSR
jgi:hypothetical protein